MYIAERPIDKRVNFEKREDYKFTFIDLFAGIGGFHQAMRYFGGKCIMASEINTACVETYKLNYKTKEVRGDIRKIEADAIGKFDVLCAGFPCQPFSKAGLQKGRVYILGIRKDLRDISVLTNDYIHKERTQGALLWQGLFLQFFHHISTIIW